jgi:hypothetical protein
MAHFVAHGSVTRLQQFKRKFESGNMLKISPELLEQKTLKKNMIGGVLTITIFTNLRVCCTFSPIKILPTVQQEGEQVPGLNDSILTK